jgi:type II secretory pathway component GspD/PulD (secretin)
LKDKIILSGNLEKHQRNYYRQVVEMFKDIVIDVVTFPGQDDSYRQLKSFFADLPTVEVKQIEDKVIISGSVDPTREDYYRQIVAIFKNSVIDLVKLPVHGDSIQIDAQVVEITQTANSDLGIEWFAAGPWQITATGTGSAATSGASSGSSGSTSSSSGSGASSSTGASTTSGSGSSSGSSSPAPGLTASGQLNLQQVTFNLIALAKDGKARLLATPKLSVQSGQKASFQVGGELPIVQTTALASNVEWKKFGTQLDVAPLIQGEDEVFVTITATVSQFDFSRQVQGNPTLLAKTASTNLKVKDRETFAIAGLLSNEESDSVSKVPILGDIPILGYIFKTKGKRYTRTETIVLFTPSILKKDPLPNAPIRSEITPSPELEKVREKLLLPKDL